MAKGSEWAAPVTAWRSSGQSVREFCAEHGYSAKLLQWWASHLRRRGKDAAATKKVAFAKVARAPAVMAEGKAGSILVRLECAWVEMPAGSDGSTLRMVLDALRSGKAK